MREVIGGRGRIGRMGRMGPISMTAPVGLRGGVTDAVEDALQVAEGAVIARSSDGAVAVHVQPGRHRRRLRTPLRVAASFNPALQRTDAGDRLFLVFASCIASLCR